MANEITVSCSLSFTKDGNTETETVAAATFDFTGTLFSKHRQDVGFAAEEAIELAAVPAGGWMLIQNTDATNFVLIRGVAADTELARINAGEFAFFRLAPGATPTVQADTAAVEIEVFRLED